MGRYFITCNFCNKDKVLLIRPTVFEIQRSQETSLLTRHPPATCHLSSIFRAKGLSVFVLYNVHVLYIYVLSKGSVDAALNGDLFRGFRQCDPRYCRCVKGDIKALNGTNI